MGEEKVEFMEDEVKMKEGSYTDIGKVYEYREYGFNIGFNQELNISNRTIKASDQTWDIYFTGEGLIVGVDTGTVFAGAMPSTGLMYAITRLVLTDGKVDFEKSRGAVALRDRYDGGQFHYDFLGKIFETGYSPFFGIEGDSRGDKVKKLIGFNISEISEVIENGK